MTTTPARDALEDATPERLFHTAEENYGWECGWSAGVRHALDNPSETVAALVESGWRPSDDDLRLMGLVEHDRLYTNKGEVTLWRPRSGEAFR